MLVNERNPALRHADYDSDATLREAESRRPFERVIEEFGHGPRNGGNWKSMECPFCKKKAKSGLFTAPDGKRLFKCHSTKCPTGAEAMDVVGFIALKSGQSRRDAFVEYLKMAGVWQDRAAFRPPPSEVPRGTTPPPSDPSPEELAAGDAVADEFAGAQTPDPERPFLAEESQGDRATVKEQVTTSDAASGATQSPQPDSPECLSVAVEIHGDPAPVTEARAATSYAAPGATQSPQPAPQEAESQPAPAAAPLIPGLTALRRFFEGLAPADTAALLAKRGLTKRAVLSLGFKANPRTNQDIIERLTGELGWDEMIASGLCLASVKDKQRRANPQFYGKGQVSKKPEVERRSRDDKWVWGWCHPVLIPYFDDHGLLVKLRPHKGGATSDTVAGRQMLYIPRRAGESVKERFHTVVICEGEFKAAAIWRIIGGGAPTDVVTRPVGVCAMPGITFGRSPEMREELHYWLRRVGARQVVVAFDDEDKSSKPMGKRHDAHIYARYLAEDLNRKLGMSVRATTLPHHWRDEKGKADWDGALAKIINDYEKKKRRLAVDNHGQAVLPAGPAS